MGRPILLDLYCGAGGASMGYYRAGWDVLGVDVKPQRHYPFPFVQGDALEVARSLGRAVQAIHASPPCQRYSAGTRAHGEARLSHPDLVGPTREVLLELGRPYVMENVLGAPLHASLILCGTSFGLEAEDDRSGLMLYLRRHRLFESSEYLAGPDTECSCAEYQKRDGWICGGVYGGASHSVERARKIRRGGYTPSPKVARVLMGIEWMPFTSLRESIPPAYTEHIGRQLLERLHAS